MRLTSSQAGGIGYTLGIGVGLSIGALVVAVVAVTTPTGSLVTIAATVLAVTIGGLAFGITSRVDLHALIDGDRVDLTLATAFLRGVALPSILIRQIFLLFARIVAALSNGVRVAPPERDADRSDFQPPFIPLCTLRYLLPSRSSRKKGALCVRDIALDAKELHDEMKGRRPDQEPRRFVIVGMVWWRSILNWGGLLASDLAEPITKLRKG